MSSFGAASPQSGDIVEAVVKWFNLTKGFGFVQPADGTADAFMHMSVLARLGMQQIAEGTKLRVEINDGQKGRQVLRIIEVLGMSELPPTNTRIDVHVPSGPEEEMCGTVKWFKTDKGFGFVTPEDGGKDVFVHKSVILRAGLHQLEPNQKLKMKVCTASKGREATQIEVIA